MDSICGLFPCKKVVETGIQCDCCGLWYHQECSRLEVASIALYAENETLQWVCASCIVLAQTCLRNQISSSAHCKPHFVTTENPGVAKSIKRPQIKQQKTTVTLETTKLQDRVEKLETFQSTVNKTMEAALGRHRNIIIYNDEEPHVANKVARHDLDNRRISDILRLSGIVGKPSIKRIHRVGQYKPDSNGVHKPRPILVEFVNPAIRDLVLSQAGAVAQSTNGRYQITADNISKNSRAFLAKSRNTCAAAGDSSLGVPENTPKNSRHLP